MSDSVVFVDSKFKAVLVLLISGGFSVLGFFIKREDPLVGWLVLVFFSIGVVVSILTLLWNKTYLRLDRNGLEIGSLLLKERYKWSDIADFRICHMRGMRMIAIEFRPEFQGHRAIRAILKNIFGLQASIPSTYNASLDEVLAALKSWHTRFGKNGT